MMFRRIISVMVVGVLWIGVQTVSAQECSVQDVDAWISQANNDYSINNYEEAIDGYTCAIEVSDEQDAYAYQWRGISKHLLGMLDGAMEDLNQSIEIDPERGTSYYSRGNVWLDFDEYELAIADFTDAIRYNYSRPFVYNNRGYAYHQIGNSDNAKIDYQNAVRIHTEYGLGYSNLGEIYFEEGDLQSTLENFELGVEYTEGIYRGYALQNRATIFYIQQDYTTAIRDYTAAIETHPEDTQAYLLRATTYRAIQSPNAYADYLRYIELLQDEIIDLEQTFIDEPLVMADGRIYRLKFDRPSGAILNISTQPVEDSDVDTLIVILGPSGNAVIGDDDSGTDKHGAIRYQTPTDGVYTVLITHGQYGDTGEFTLRYLLPNQLDIGVRAEIFATSNDGAGTLNLREYPSLGFDVLEQLPSGTQVTIVNQPYKDTDFVWWQVETDTGQVGWVAEHVGGEQTLFPAIQVGGTVFVNVQELNLRADPSSASERVDVLIIGENSPVVDGPVEADGFRWWKLRNQDGTEGWAVERVDDNRTLMAVVESR